MASTPDGRRLEVSRVIGVTRDVVWDVLRDTERWSEWGPSVKDVESPVRFVERGTRGRVRTVLGLWLPFEVTTCESYRWAWDVARLPATGHRAERVDDERCRVVFEVPPLAAGYVPVCRQALSRIESVAHDAERGT